MEAHNRKLNEIFKWFVSNWYEGGMWMARRKFSNMFCEKHNLTLEFLIGSVENGEG
jgi:hypothetical protein